MLLPVHAVPLVPLHAQLMLLLLLMMMLALLLHLLRVTVGLYDARVPCGSVASTTRCCCCCCTSLHSQPLLL
jgi:hypothetical protein